MEFIIESQNDEYLKTFLFPIDLLKDETLFVDKSYHLIMLSNQFKALKNREPDQPKEDLFYHFLRNEEHRKDGIKYLYTFLEEKRIICDIKNDLPIDEILKLLGIEQGQKIQDIDDLLGQIVAYWTPDDKNYDKYKKVVISLGKFYSLLFMVLENQEKLFVENFHSNMLDLESQFKKRYLEYDPLYIVYFLYVLFLCALLNERENICDCILELENFGSFKINLPTGLRVNRKIMQNLLKRGFQLTEGSMYSSWINKEILSDFLESRVKFKDDLYISMDTSFLKIPDRHMCCGENETLEFILGNEDLKQCIIHPTIASYIILKSKKYDFVEKYNLIFAILYIISFVLLVMFSIEKWRYPCMGAKIVCSLFTMGLFARETFQFWAIHKSSPKNYFTSHWTNWFEFALIIVSAATLYFFWFKTESYPILYVLKILLSALVLLPMIPVEFYLLHIMMLENVAKRFVKVFGSIIFAILLVFTFCFYIVYGSEDVKQDSKSTPDIIQSEVNDILQNFSHSPAAIMKSFSLYSF